MPPEPVEVPRYHFRLSPFAVAPHCQPQSQGCAIVFVSNVQEPGIIHGRGAVGAAVASVGARVGAEVGAVVGLGHVLQHRCSPA